MSRVDGRGGGDGGDVGSLDQPSMSIGPGRPFDRERAGPHEAVKLYRPGSQMRDAQDALKQHGFGEVIAKGSTNVVYGVPDHENLAIRVYKYPKAPGVRGTVESYNELSRAGVPHVLIGEIFWHDPEGKLQQGLLEMRPVAMFTYRKKDVQPSWVESSSGTELVNDATFKGLDQIYSNLRKKDLTVNGLKFGIFPDGTLRIVDPGKTSHGIKYPHGLYSERKRRVEFLEAIAGGE